MQISMFSFILHFCTFVFSKFSYMLSLAVFLLYLLLFRHFVHWVVNNFNKSYVLVNLSFRKWKENFVILHYLFTFLDWVERKSLIMMIFIGKYFPLHSKWIRYLPILFSFPHFTTFFYSLFFVLFLFFFSIYSSLTLHLNRTFITFNQSFSVYINPAI